MKCGLLFRPGSFWVGVHWSARNRRLCINPLPMITIWITLKGGTPPSKSPETFESQDQADEAYAAQILAILEASGRDGCLDEDVLYLAQVWREQAAMDRERS